MSTFTVPEEFLYLMNQLFDLERKSRKIEGASVLQRNIDRMKQKFEEMGLVMDDPLGEPFNDTRTDVDANIAGESANNLVITEVIKPIIRIQKNGLSVIVQKGVVIAETR